MGGVVESAKYFFTGRYDGTEGHDSIWAANIFGSWGGDAKIYAKGGNDSIHMASLAATVYTGHGHDKIYGVAGGLKVRDDSGHLELYGASGKIDVRKYQWGNIKFGAGVIDSYIESHQTGDIYFAGAAGSSRVKKYGDGKITFKGVAGYSKTYQSGHGDIYFAMAAGYADVDKYGNGKIEFKGAAGGADVYQKGSGDITFSGAAGSVDVDKHGSGNVRFYGAAAHSDLYQDGNGDVLFNGAAGYADVEKHGDGKIEFKGAAGGANVTQNGSGDIHFGGAGGGVTINKTGDGKITVHGASAHTGITQNNGVGDIEFKGVGANVNITKTAESRYQKTTQVFTGFEITFLLGFIPIPVSTYRTHTEWVDRKTGNIILGAGVANVNINYTKGDGDVIFQGAAGNINNLSHDKGNIIMHGAVGRANINKSGDGNIEFKGAAGLNQINHKGTSGNTSFNGAGGANIINHHASGNLSFNGAGGANVLTHQGTSGNTSFNGAGFGNVIVHKAKGNVTFNGAGLGNVIYHGGSTGDLNVSAGGLVNVLVREGHGQFNATLLAAANISVHVGNGDQNVFQLGGLNTHTHVGDGDAVVGMAGGFNVATFIGDGTFYGGLLGLGNVMTKVGTGDTYIAALGAGNVLTHIDTSDNDSNTAALLLGGANILTKAGNGDLMGIMAGGLNVATSVGKGDVAMAQLGGGNILTKVGDGDSVAVQFGIGNINTQVGNGRSLALMAGAGNIYTKVGDGLSAAGMLGLGNIYTHVGSGDSLAVMAAKGNVFTKVEVNDQNPDDITATAMFGGGNIFTHVGDGTTGALMLSLGNVFTKVGDGTTVAAMGGKGNIATHVGDGMTLAVMGAKGNILTKVGDGTTAGLMMGGGNIFTHVGDGNTIGLTAGKGNIVTKVGQGDQINVAFGKGNLVTHVSTEGDNNNSYNLSLGEGNILTKVGDGKQVNVVGGKANIVTHVGNGDDVNLIFGQQASIVTKVGDGDTITGIINSKLNVITHVGDGDNLQGVWGQGNIVTKVGDGTASSAMKGDANIITAVGDGAQVGVLWGKGNIVTKVGDGTSVNILKGEGNIHTKIGDGTSIGVMKGSANINIQVGDGNSIFAAHGNHNISVQVGDGDYYGFAFAKGKSTLLENAKTLGSNLLQTAGGFIGSEVISQLVWGAPPSGSNEQETPEISPEDSLETPSLDTVDLSFDEENLNQRSQSNYSSQPDTISIEEKNPSTNLNDNTVKTLNNNNQSSEMAASGSLAGQAGAKLQEGLDQVKTDINSLIDESERILGNGGEVSQVLDQLTNTLVSQLGVLDDYIDKGDDLLFGGSNEGNNSTQNEFSQGIVGRVNNDLDDTFDDVNEQLKTADDKVNEAEIEITKAKLEAEKRQQDADDNKSDALDAKSEAQQKQQEAENRGTDAENKANAAKNEANNQVNETKNNPQGEKRSEDDKPTDRKASEGSGLDNKNVKTEVTVDDAFYEFSESVINGNQENTLSNQQKELLQGGLDDIKILLANSSTEEEEEEEEEEGGLTDGQLNGLSDGRRANMNLGLKTSWKESEGVKQWTESSYQLTSNVRGGKSDAPFKEQITNTINGLNLLERSTINYATKLALGDKKGDLGNPEKFSKIVDKIYENISTESLHLLESKLGKDEFDLTVKKVIIESAMSMTLPKFNNTSNEVTTTLFYLLDQYFKYDSQLIDSWKSQPIPGILRYVFSQRELHDFLKSQENSDKVLKSADIYNIIIQPIGSQIHSTVNDLESGVIGDYTKDYIEQLNSNPGGFKSDYLDISFSGGVGSGIGTKKLFDDVIKVEPQLFYQLKTFIKQADRNTSENEINAFFDGDDYIKEATTAKGFSGEGESLSKNHIVADTFVKLILANLVSKTSINEVQKTKIGDFIDSLVGVNDEKLKTSLGEENLNNLASQAKTALFHAIENSDINKLYTVYNLLSYAPGNIRYGDQHFNGLKSNYFDAPLIVEEGDGQYSLRYIDAAENIAESIQGLAAQGLINSDIAKYATLTDFANGKPYSSNPLLKKEGDTISPLNDSVMSQDDGYESKYLFGTEANIKPGDDTQLTESLKFAKEVQNNLTDSTQPKYVSKSKLETTIDIDDNGLVQNVRGGSSIVDTESSGVDKLTKRIDYQDIHSSTNEAGDKLTVYKIIDPNGGEAQYRVQIDIEGDESKRISIFSSENPVQADGSIRLPDTTTIVSHGEKLEGQTYTSEVENSYLGQDDKYLKIGANDFRNVENLEAAEHKPANSTNNVYELTKYRGKDEGLGIDMAKNQEQVLLTTLRDRSANGKANMGYMTVGKRSKVTSQDAEAALSRLGTKSVVSGYCRACATVDNAETYRAKVKESAKATHLDGEKLFANNIRQTIEDVAIVRNTNLEGRRNVSIKQLVKDAESIGGQIKRKAFQTAPQLTFTGMKYVDGQYQDTHGNLQVQVGDGEFTAAFWGNTNIGIKVGDGGFKAAAFGDNNIFVHIGDGDTAKHTQTIGNYNAFEGAQLFIGQRNVSFNYGVSNDFIVMVDKSIPLPPFQSPFSGPTDIVGYLKEDIAQFNVNGDKDDIDPLTGDPIEDNYYDSQNYLWSKGNAKQIIDQISTLDMNSSVEYETVFDYGSESDRNTRALQADAERALNKGFNRVMAGQSPFKKAQGTPLKDQNFNLTIAGQGADIILTNGDNQFMFADNIPSLLDTTIASVFGMLSQETNAENGQVGNTLSYDPRNALGNFLNQLIARVSASLPDLTLGEALGLTYDAQGNITKTEAQRLSQEDLDSIRDAFAQFVSQNGQKVGLDLKNEETGANFDITNPSNLLGLFEAFGNGNLSKFIDPDGLVDSLKSALDIGEDGLKSFQNYFAPEEETEETENSSTTETPESDNPSPPEVPVIESSEVFGFGGLTLPSVFDIDIPQLFSTKTLDDMVGLVNSFDGDIDTMQEQMFDFFANSGYMTGDGDLLVSLGNNNLTWGGDGNDLVGLMGLNNNFWGGDGDDLYYGMGENNQGSGNKGDDTAVLIGINNLFFGGEGHDFALAAGRYANLSGGDGDDTLYVLGSDSWLNGGEGENYLVAVGNYNAVVSGDGNDYIVSIGNYGDVESGAGQDVVTVFGNKNTVKTGEDDDYLRIMGHQGEVFAGAGDDFIWTDVEAKDNVIKGDIGNDTFVLGGSNNIYYSGEGKDSFIISDNYQNAVIKDITVDDLLMFADVADNELWFKQEEDDLLIYLQQTPNNEGDELTHSTLTIEDYFNNQQANIVLDTGLVSDSGEAAYEILTQQGLGSLINIMSQYDVVGSTDAFLDNVSDEDLEKLAIAWDKTSIV